ncbi:hypothetical protein KS407_15425 [Bacillus alkalicola]|uniref:Uncharacterized protein n=1 Tax=Evansella alkalicola TaxID=745819 RepID=A0ABS6JXI4_9BACI|nr:hypothetical protein [Bacillus alkalicola]
MTGFLSFLLALIALAIVNISFLTGFNGDGALFSFFYISLLGFFLGIVGLFTKKRSRLFAIWGFFLNLFVVIFPFLMFILAYTINATP